MSSAKAKPAKVPASHPKYIDMIENAIKALADKSGSSRQAINKYIVKEYNLTENNHHNAMLKQALKRGSGANGPLVHNKGKGAAGSFKIKPAPAKPAKPAAKKKSAVKKGPSKKKAPTKPAKPVVAVNVPAESPPVAPAPKKPAKTAKPAKPAKTTKPKVTKEKSSKKSKAASPKKPKAVKAKKSPKKTKKGGASKK